MGRDGKAQKIKFSIVPAGAGRGTCQTARPAWHWNYPCRRGEEIANSVLAQPLEGLPPQARRNIDVVRQLVAFDWSTPANAGKRERHCCSLHYCWGQPRKCGEKIIRNAAKMSPPGLPSQMRGKAMLGSAHEECIGSSPQVRRETDHSPPSLPECRINPASAGRSCISRLMAQSGQDHPRRCGEKTCGQFIGQLKIGSPPQVRGEGAVRLVLSREVRITPAGAGRRSRGCFPAHRGRDHPRRCGEKRPWTWQVVSAKGSPPQVRGEDSIMDGLQGVHGITPAGAGRRMQIQISRKQNRDHQRRCGEKCRRRGRPANKKGSPPQVRGEATYADRAQMSHGITPAGAGRSSMAAMMGLVPWGSPPQVRGEGSGIPSVGCSRGITPAGAGRRNLASV